MNILVLNSGSSSLKYQLIDMTTEKVLAKGICEKIGSDENIVKQVNFNGKRLEKTVTGINNHVKAFEWIEKMLMSKEYGPIDNIEEIAAVGHRVVHGGEYFKDPAFIDNDVIDKIRELIPLAPLHNGAHLSGILACREMLGNHIPQVAVFDTSFYYSLPEKAYMFPIPYEYYKKYHLRKYGFHGTSHKYVSNKMCDIFKKDINKLKIISCHMGNGSSITAIDKGKAIETSMGLTPLGGIIMGTRSGSIDPSVILHLFDRESLTSSELNNILNKKSGMLGISGVSSDDREICEAEKKGNHRAKLSHEMMVYQLMQYIGAYNAILKGCDCIIFTGGIGENQWMHREKICEELRFMGVEIDKEINRETIEGKANKISKDSSKIEIFVIPTNEELAIARETLSLINHSM